jgi:phosphohistidine phosphatase SixA
MKKLLAFLFILILSSTAHANEDGWKLLQEGGKIVWIRHAITTPSCCGDPDNLKINDRSTQRNLGTEGIEQSKKIGQLFKKNNVEIDQVLSSQFERCRDTAKYAFGDYKDFPALNSFFRQGIGADAKRQLKDIQNFVKNWNSKKNLVFVTHQVVISNSVNETVSSGELVITDKILKYSQEYQRFNYLTLLSSHSLM